MTSWLPAEGAGTKTVKLQWQVGVYDKPQADNDLPLETLADFIEEGSEADGFPASWTAAGREYTAVLRQARETYERAAQDGLTRDSVQAYERSRKKAKEFLPAVTVSAHCQPGTRLKESVTHHTGLVVIDYDKLPDKDTARSLRDRLHEHTDTVLLSFISPSGRGVKAIVPVDPVPRTEAEHQAAYHAAVAELDAVAERAVDIADESVRLCFVVKDPERAFSPDAVPVRWQRSAVRTTTVKTVTTTNTPADQDRPPPPFHEVREALWKTNMTVRSVWLEAMGSWRGWWEGCTGWTPESGLIEFEAAASRFPSHGGTETQRREYINDRRFLPARHLFELARDHPIKPVDYESMPEKPLEDPPVLTEKIAGSAVPKIYRADSDWPIADKLKPREWLVHGWLPFRMGMLTGAGGSGKSWLALQLACSVAAGRGALEHGRFLPVNPHLLGNEERDAELDSLGALMIDPSHAVIASWEEEPEELQWRRASLERALSWASPETIDDRLHWFVPDGDGASTLWGPEHGKSTSTTGGEHALGRALRKYCEDVKARLLVIDNAAACFGGDENQRTLVRQFMTHWDRWAIRTKTAVVLVGHPPKSDATYSGSTDWRNASRWMWVLDSAAMSGPDSDVIGQDGKTVKHGNNRPKKRAGKQLRLDKCNYSSTDGKRAWLRQLYKHDSPDSSSGAWQQCSMLDSVKELDQRMGHVAEEDRDPVPAKTRQTKKTSGGTKQDSGQVNGSGQADPLNGLGLDTSAFIKTR